jgi:glycosyltransferase involved in cell wall biosynthesis
MDLLPHTLKSILDQTYKNIEIIIVDDCSTDGTEELILNSLLRQDNRIRYIPHKENKGLAYARNTAINNAKGKYFTFCDDDDIWDKSFVEIFVSEALNYAGNWCFCCGYKLKKNGKVLCVSPNKKEMLLKSAITEGYTPPVAGQFYNTLTLQEIGGYNQNIKSGVDHDLWLSLSYINTHILFIDKCPVSPGFAGGANRMTTDFKKRINGIGSSLGVWQDDIVRNYGSSFYVHFRNEYNYYLFKRIVKNNLNIFKANQVAKRFLFKNKGFFVRIFFELIKSKINFFRNHEIKFTPLFRKKEI